MSIDFNAKKHHIWLHLAPILSGIYLQKEYNQITQRVPQFLLQSLIHNLKNKKLVHSRSEFGSLSQSISSMIHHGLSIRTLSPWHFVPMQSMVWTVDILRKQAMEFEDNLKSSKSTGPMPLEEDAADYKAVFATAQGLMFDEKKSWYQSLRTLYPGMDVAQFVNSGINSLMIMNILKQMADHDVPINSCNSMIAFLQHLTSHLATDSLSHQKKAKDSNPKQQETHYPAAEQMWNNGTYLMALFCLTLSAFHRAFEREDYELVVQNGYRLWQNWNLRRAERVVLTRTVFDNVMAKTTDIRLKQLVEQQIVSNLYTVCERLFGTLSAAKTLQEQKALNWKVLGVQESTMWVLLGLIRLNLLFPARFFDPNLKFKIRLQDCDAMMAEIFEEIELRKRIELFHSGKSSNFTIKKMQKKYKSMAKKKSNLLSKVTYRPEADVTFADFWHEVTNFINNQFDTKHVIQLFDKFIENANGDNDGNVKSIGDGNYLYQQLRSRMQSSINFVQRLHDHFAPYNDFVAPIIDAIELVRYGISYAMITCNVASTIMTNGIQRLLSPITPSCEHPIDLMHSEFHELLQKNCGHRNEVNKRNKEMELRGGFKALSGTKISGKLLLCGLRQSIHFVMNTGHRSQFLSYDEMEIFDNWFSLFAHLFHEQEERRRAELAEKQVINLIKYDISFFLSLSAFMFVIYCRKTDDLIKFIEIKLVRLADIDSISLFVSRFCCCQHIAVPNVYDQFINIECVSVSQELYKMDFDAAKIEKEEDARAFWEMFPDYLLDFRHLTASNTLHHKTQMVEDVERMKTKLARHPDLVGKRAEQLERMGTKQLLDDVLEDEKLADLSPTQKFAFDIHRRTDNTFKATLSTKDIKEIFRQHLYIFSQKTRANKSTVSGDMIKQIADSLSTQHRMAGILTELLSVKANDLGDSDPEKHRHDDSESLDQSEKTAKSRRRNYGHSVTVNKSMDSIGQISYILSASDLFARFTSMGKVASKSDSIITAALDVSTLSRSKRLRFQNPIDVYNQSVPSYIRIVEKPLQSFSVRIASLLSAYPKHSVLIQLSELCSHLSELSTRSPIMKVLTGLELLLSKAKSDWEDTCAAKHTSITEQMVPIWKLIGFWRRLELQSWSAIFQGKEQEICDAAINNWFYLYSLIHTEEITDNFIKGILEERKARERRTLHHEESFIKYESSLTPEQVFGVKAEEILQRIEASRNNPHSAFTKEEKAHIFCQEMFRHLNEFLENAPIGEIDIRLMMIQSFYQQINCELYTKYNRHRLDDVEVRVKVLRMIGNLIDYHSQFDDVITEYKTTKFGPMKDKLKELVKFAKWDLRNYWKLRQSAQKSHRRLAKLCQEWKVALKRSVSGILSEREATETNEAAQQDVIIKFGEAEMDMLRSKRNKFLRRIFGKKTKKRGKGSDKGDVDDFKPHKWLTTNPVIVYKSDSATATSQRTPSDIAFLKLSIGNMPKLLAKMKKLQTRFYGHRHWQHRASMQHHLESLCSSIIVCTKEYANTEIPFPRKKRMFAVLLQHLKQNGLRLSAPGDIDHLLPDQLFLNHHLCPKDAQSVMTDMEYSDTYNRWMETLLDKSQSYYHAVVRKMCQLRARRMAVHSDLLQDVSKCYGVCERLLSCILVQRNALDLLLKQIATLKQWHLNISVELHEESRAKTLSVASPQEIESLFWSLRQKLSILSQSVHTLTTVYSKVMSISKKRAKTKKESKSKQKKMNEIFNSDELAHFEEAIPDFIADEDFEDDIDCSKIKDPVIQSLINSKTYLTEEYGTYLEQIKKIGKRLNAVQEIFDEVAAHKLSPQKYELMHHECFTPFWALNTVDKLLTVHHNLKGIYASLQPLPCFDNLNIAVEFNAVKTSPTREDRAMSGEYTTCYEAVVKEIQFCIQDVIHLVNSKEFISDLAPDPITEYDADDDDDESDSDESDNEIDNANAMDRDMDEVEDMMLENVYGKYFAFQQQSFLGITKAFHGKEIAEKLQSLIEGIHSAKQHDGKVLHGSLSNLLWMIEDMIRIGTFAFNHNLQSHKSFCKLQYILTSLFNGLFVKGFCKKKEEEEDGNELDTNELGEGTGMGDGKGQQDVSHEMENEGQVEGLQNDQQQNENKDEQKEESDGGIDMQQDFAGDLYDLEEAQPEEQKKNDDDSEDDEVEDVDREMGEMEFDKSQVIDERLWGSDDEEEEEQNKNNEKNENKEEEQQQQEDRNQKDLDHDDKFAQVQAKQNANDEDEEQDEQQKEGKDEKPDAAEDEKGDDDKTEKQKEEQVATLEYADPLEDLDGNVDEEEATMEEKEEKGDEGDDGEGSDFEEQCPRKDFELDENMNIEFSDDDEDGDGGAQSEDDEKGNDEDDGKTDMERMQDELDAMDADREEEKLEDLERGTGEIMPENEAQDEDMDAFNEDGDDADKQEDEGDENAERDIMDIDKEELEESGDEQKEDGNAESTQKDENAEPEEESDVEMDETAKPNDADILKPNMPETEEKEKEEDEDGDGTEMKKEEEKEEDDTKEAKQEELEQEDANMDETNDNEEDAMGVSGGQGQDAPMCDENEEEEDEEDIEMNKEDENPVQQELSEFFGDEQQMMQDDTRGEWQPMQQDQQQNKDKNQEEKKDENREMDDKTNPFRSLGDALSEWKQRLDIIDQDEDAQREEVVGDEEEKETKEEDPGGDDVDADQYAHIPEDMEVDEETQALADAQDEDETAKIPYLVMVIQPLQPFPNHHQY